MNSNKIYIFTMVYNEQRYIDEWIQYHLNIGIDKIIIFEDINSNPHDISKYGDKVILHRIIDCFNENEINTYNTKRRHVSVFQCFYRLYSNECDWSTCIDVDEFIECDNVLDIIFNKEKYAQLQLVWKNYTYNGHIKDPYPNQVYSVRETYTEVNNADWDFKSFFNMHNELIIKNFNNPMHVPHYIIDWHDANNTYFSEYRLAHYKSKSFEEYTNDLFVKGRFEGWTRNLSHFFKINELNEEDYKDLIKKYKNKEVKTNYYYTI